jgi:transcriptional regulator with XRE-family HTH domain
MTQAQLAQAAKVREATLTAIENERTTGVDFDVLERLAVALGVDPGFLVVRTAAKGKKR